MIAAPGNIALEEIRRVYDDKKNGVLCLGKEGQSIDVFYREGIIDAVSSTLHANRLGQYLLREGYFEARDLEPLLQKSNRQKITVGETAVRDGLLDPVELADVL